MTPTEQRLGQLAKEHLGLDNPPFDSRLSAMGVSSVDIVAFGKVAVKDFNIDMSPEDCGSITNLSEFAKFIDNRKG